MRTQYISLITTTALLFFSCVKEPEQPKGGLDDGTATLVTLSIKSDSRSSVDSRSAMMPLGTLPPSVISATRALTPEQESKITNVRIIVFDAAKAVVFNEYKDNLSITGTDNIPIKIKPGKEMQIVVVANSDMNDPTLDNKLNSITKLDEFEELIVDIDNENLVRRTDRLMMVGTTTVTITSNNAPIPVELHFLETKITLNIKDDINSITNNDRITITGWDVVNIPKKSYLKERINPSEDAVVGSTPADYTATDDKFTFDEVNPKDKTWAQTIYLFENRRGNRVDREDEPLDKYPGMSVTDTNQRGKAWYAPVGATYMLIYGTYIHRGGTTSNVVYKILLGENSINDYNLFRGKHYNYNVTIRGLNEIDVDTNVDWGPSSFIVYKSENMDMDAHPDFRVLRISGTAESGVIPAYATVQVLDIDGETPCTWLAVSPLDLYNHSIKQTGNANQQFALSDGVGTYVRPKYNPEPTNESEFTEATFGMTRFLTKIPFTQLTVTTYKNIFIYADAYNGTGLREAKVKVSYYKGVDGTDKVGEVSYKVTQKGAIKISNEDDLWIENYEENCIYIYPFTPYRGDPLWKSRIRWGHTGNILCTIADDRYSNGNWLTANAIYNNVTPRSELNPPTWTANTYIDYRDKYTLTGEKITEPSSLATTGEPYFYPDVQLTTQLQEYFHPIYNSSAARYCHEKNRDTNGDGIISDSETEWFLPSYAEFVSMSEYLYESSDKINVKDDVYWTSSEESESNAIMCELNRNGINDILSVSKKTEPAYVLCMRGKGRKTPDPAVESTESDKTKMNLEYISSASAPFKCIDWTSGTITSSDPTWLHIATSSSGRDHAKSMRYYPNLIYHAFTLSENSSTVERQATIAISRIGVTSAAKNLTVTQKIASPTVEPLTMTIPYDGAETSSFNIKLEGDWSASVDSESSSWLAISRNSDGISNSITITGSDNETLYAVAKSQNDGTTPRIGKINVTTTSNNIYSVNVVNGMLSEMKLYPNIGWAGSYIYLQEGQEGEPDRLTFKGRNDRSMEQIAGALFKYGSLVAISATYMPQAVHIQYSPVAWVTNRTKYDNVPYIQNAGGPIENGEDLDNRAHPHILDFHAPEAGIGDICKYITDKGWAPEGNWRMPVAYELVSTPLLILNETPQEEFDWNFKDNGLTKTTYVYINRREGAERGPSWACTGTILSDGKTYFPDPQTQTIQIHSTTALEGKKGRHTICSRYNFRNIIEVDNNLAVPVRCVLADPNED